MNKASVGIIGLGSMGMGIGISLIRNNFPVFGFDIDTNLCEKLLSSGALKCGKDFLSCLKELDVLLIVVVNSRQVEQILFDKIPSFLSDENLASQLKPSCVIVNHSTISAESAKYFANKLKAEYNLTLVNAPMSGGSLKAKEGKLTLMISGEDEKIKNCQHIFDCFAERTYFVGEDVGLASTVKIIHQLLAGVHIAAAAESLAMAAKAGISLSLMYDIVTHAAGNSWMFENRGAHIVKGDYTPRSAVDIFVKDLGLVLETGNYLDIQLPLASKAHQMFCEASDQGYGKEDDAAVIKIFKGLNLPEQNNSE